MTSPNAGSMYVGTRTHPFSTFTNMHDRSQVVSWERDFSRNPDRKETDEQPFPGEGYVSRYFERGCNIGQLPEVSCEIFPHRVRCPHVCVPPLSVSQSFQTKTSCHRAAKDCGRLLVRRERCQLSLPCPFSSTPSRRFSVRLCPASKGTALLRSRYHLRH